jgi:cell division protein FtsQ
MDRRRRRRRILAAALLVVSAAVGLWMLAHSQLVAIGAVDVEGSTNLDASEVVEASGIAVGDPLVRLNTAAAVDSLESNPWVAEASVRRSWIDRRVVVQVTERVPVAAVATAAGDGMALVDSSGQVLAVVADPAGLPVVTGVVPGAPGERLDPVDRGVIAAAGAIPPGLATRVDAVTPGVNGRIELVLDDGAVVLFGGVEDLGTKIRTIQTVLATVDLQCVTVIDVAVADTAVLTRGEPCA